MLYKKNMRAKNNYIKVANGISLISSHKKSASGLVSSKYGK